jgi:hypothetical protein
MGQDSARALVRLNCPPLDATLTSPRRKCRAFGEVLAPDE